MRCPFWAVGLVTPLFSLLLSCGSAKEFPNGSGEGQSQQDDLEDKLRVAFADIGQEDWSGREQVLRIGRPTIPRLIREYLAYTKFGTDHARECLQAMPPSAVLPDVKGMLAASHPNETRLRVGLAELLLMLDDDSGVRVMIENLDVGDPRASSNLERLARWANQPIHVEYRSGGFVEAPGAVEKALNSWKQWWLEHRSKNRAEWHIESLSSPSEHQRQEALRELKAITPQEFDFGETPKTQQDFEGLSQRLTQWYTEHKTRLVWGVDARKYLLRAPEKTAPIQP